MAATSNALEEGKLAAESREQRADKPSPVGSPEAKQWEAGFQFVIDHGGDKDDIPISPALAVCERAPS